MDSILEHFKFLLKDIDNYNSLLVRNQSYIKFTIDSVFNQHSQDSINKIFAVISTEKLLDNKIIEDEATRVLSCILSVSKLSEEFLNEEIEKIKNEILEEEQILRNLEGNERQQTKTKALQEVLVQNKRLLALYEQRRMVKAKDNPT